MMQRKVRAKKTKAPPPRDITFHLSYCGIELDFSLAESLSVTKLKEQLYCLSGIPVTAQEITGLPEVSDEATQLSLLNLPDTVNLTLSGEPEEEAIKQFEKNYSETIEDLDFDEETIKYVTTNDLIDDYFYEENNSNSINIINENDPIDLSMNEVLEKLQVDEKFINLFNERYGDSHPRFIIGSIKNVITQSIREKKLFLIYLHNSTHENTLPFCCETLCSPSFRNFIDEHFLFWIGNLPTKLENFQVLELEFSSFPIVIIAMADDNGSVSVIDVIKGLIGPDEFISNLSSFAQ